MKLDGIGSLLGVKSPWVVADVKIQEKNKVVDVHIDYERGSQFHCPCCGNLAPVHDSSVKRIRHLDIFEYRCYLNIKTPRTNCDRDGIKVTHADPWSHQGSHYSYKFEAMIVRWCKEMSVVAISKELGEPDQNLWRVFLNHVKYQVLDTFDFREVRRVCVDETAVERGQSYISIFTDYDTGRVLFVDNGRKMDVFSSFYNWLFYKGGNPGEIELFSMDMSVSYQAGRRAYFGSSLVVFDRFHIKKCLNEAVNQVRCEEVETEKTLKKTKYIWLKNEQKLTHSQKEKLHEFLSDSSLDTARAYQVKKSFDQLWDVQSQAVEPLLGKWIQLALSLKLEPINKFVETVYSHYDGILQSIKTGITNAVSEGLNSVIQLARSRARGFRNIDNFKYMVYFIGNS